MTNQSIREILDKHAEYYIRQTMKFFQENGVSPALSKDNPGDLEALKAIYTLVEGALPEKYDTRFTTAGNGLEHDVGYNHAVDDMKSRLDKVMKGERDA